MQADISTDLAIDRNSLEIPGLLIWSNAVQGLTEFADRPKWSQQVDLECLRTTASDGLPHVIREFAGQLYDGNRGCHVTRYLSHNEALGLFRGGSVPRVTRQSGALFVGGTMDEIGDLAHVGETRTAAQLNAIGGFFAARREIDVYPAVHSRMQAKPACGSGSLVHVFTPRPHANPPYKNELPVFPAKRVYAFGSIDRMKEESPGRDLGCRYQHGRSIAEFC